MARYSLFEDDNLLRLLRHQDVERATMIHWLAAAAASQCRGCALPARSPAAGTGGSRARLELDRINGIATSKGFAEAEAYLRLGQPRKFTSATLAALLIEQARAELPESPNRSLGWARLATAVAEPGETQEHQDQLARAMAFEANAHRARSDFAGAENVLMEARRRIAKTGLTDPTAAGELEMIEGRLRAAQGRFREAILLLRRAAASHACGENSLGIALALIALSLAHNEGGEHVAALDVGRTALLWSEEAGEASLEQSSRFNLVLFLFDSGACHPALEELARFRAFCAHRKLPLSRSLSLRVRWLEARLLGELGDPETAREQLWALQREFVSDSDWHPALLLIVHLAQIEWRVGRVEAYRDLARAVGQIADTGSDALHAAATAAVASLHSALSHRTLDAEQIKEFEWFFRHSGQNPGLLFAA